MTETSTIVSLHDPLLKSHGEGVIVRNRDGLVPIANDAVPGIFRLDRDAGASLPNLDGHNLHSSLIRTASTALTGMTTNDVMRGTTSVNG